MEINHEHSWRVMFTQTKNGEVIWSFLRCIDCDKRKEVEGEYRDPTNMDNTWSSNPAKYTK